MQRGKRLSAISPTERTVRCFTAIVAAGVLVTCMAQTELARRSFPRMQARAPACRGG